MDFYIDVNALNFDGKDEVVSITPNAIAAALNEQREFDQEEFFRALYYGLDVSAREELRRAIRS